MDYAIVGNCKTGALISLKGGVHWMCYPDFDSPSVFAKLLDESNGGSFEFAPDSACKYHQSYLANTNVLETVVSCDTYSFRVLDFFPRYKKLLPGKKSTLLKTNCLMRIFEPLKGKPRIKIIFDPKLNYAQGETFVSKEENRLVASNKDKKLYLSTNTDLDSVLDSKYIELSQRAYFVFGEKVEISSTKHCLDFLRWTRQYWLKWVSTLVLPEKNKELIIRSALALKLLTYSETGAILAALTTSLPEEIGSERTWDYRFCWVRDAAYCSDAFQKIGRDHESKKLMEFIINRVIKDDYLMPLYGVRGETRLKERLIENLGGFKDSKPVRVGNDAYKQEQHDIYGEMIDILYLYFAYYEYEKKMSSRHWRLLKYLVNQIKFNWEKKDSGIWEFRGIQQHYTFSKFMCYVGVDRAIKLAQYFQRDDLAKEWLDLREEIRGEVLKKGYSPEKNAFTMFYGGQHLDAALLLMTYHEFLEAADPRVVSTIKTIYKELRSDSLVMRYTMPDDFGKPVNAFVVCSFWLVDALNYIGETEKAKELFENVVKKANHLGLFSEDIDLKTGEQTGNFVQAYAHIALINSAILLSEWSMKRKKIDWGSVKRKKWF